MSAFASDGRHAAPSASSPSIHLHRWSGLGPPLAQADKHAIVGAGSVLGAHHALGGERTQRVVSADWPTGPTNYLLQLPLFKDPIDIDAKGGCSSSRRGRSEDVYKRCCSQRRAGYIDGGDDPSPHIIRHLDLEVPGFSFQRLCRGSIKIYLRRYGRAGLPQAMSDVLVVTGLDL